LRTKSHGVFFIKITGESTGPTAGLAAPPASDAVFDDQSNPTLLHEVLTEEPTVTPLVTKFAAFMEHKIPLKKYCNIESYLLVVTCQKYVVIT
jgi:hypothetical protein